MKIEIKSRFTGKVLVSGNYESIKDFLQKNIDADLGGADLRDADLRGAYLRDADLRDADLGGAYLRGAYLRDADLRGAYLRGADLGGADLRGAYLGGADLGGAYLRGAYLRDAYLRDADLGGIKGYSESHDLFIEAVRRQKIELFIDTEWVAIAQVTIHRLCWDSIRKRFSDVMPGIFRKLADAGFSEWLEIWNNFNRKGVMRNESKVQR